MLLKGAVKNQHSNSHNSLKVTLPDKTGHAINHEKAKVQQAWISTVVAKATA